MSNNLTQSRKAAKARPIKDVRRAVYNRMVAKHGRYITAYGLHLRRFIFWPAEIRDGTLRCIGCGQIDDQEYHDTGICRDVNASFEIATKPFFNGFFGGFAARPGLEPAASREANQS